MRKITLANGETIEVECLSCAVAGGLVEPTGGVIYEDEFFHAHQDVAYPIPGLVILAAKRHFYCMDELTVDESKRYMELIRRIRDAQRKALGIDHIYYFYNEDTTHHFHLWMVPRYDWMKPFGRSVESLRPVLLYARNAMNDEENLRCVMRSIEKLRKALNHGDGMALANNFEL